MAAEAPGTGRTFTATEDLTGKQFYGVKIGATDRSCLLCDTQGAKGLGVLHNKPDGTNGDVATVITSGQVKAVADAAIAVGASVTVQNDGQFMTAATGDVIWGQAVTAAGAAGEVFILDLDAGPKETSA